VNKALEGVEKVVLISPLGPEHQAFTEAWVAALEKRAGSVKHIVRLGLLGADHPKNMIAYVRGAQTLIASPRPDPPARAHASAQRLARRERSADRQHGDSLHRAALQLLHGASIISALAYA
jgi:hypothetical protein